MIKTNKNIDYGKALTELLDRLKFAEEKLKTDEEYKYPQAYGRLAQAVKTHLIVCSDLELSDIQKVIDGDNADDIPAELFQSPGTK